MTRIDLSDEDAFNAGDTLIERAADRGAMLLGEEENWTADTLRTRSLAVQSGLSARGLAPGDRVLLLLLDSPWFHAAFLGALRGGFLPVPISTLMPAKDVEFIARDSNAALALVDPALPAEIRSGLMNSASCPVVDPREFSTPATVPAVYAARAGDAAFWLYTSGTTGQPKGVIHRHVDLPATAELYAGHVLGIRPDDILFSAAKLFFAYGLGNGLTFPLWWGARVGLFAGQPIPRDLYARIETLQPTIFFGVPTLFASMLADPASAKTWQSVRLCVSAGEALPASIYEEWHSRYGVEILDGLGSTEMLHIFLSNRPGAVRPGTSGVPVAGYQIRIVDENDIDVSRGEVGTLIAGGPSAARAYHDRPAQTRETMFEPGWLRSGDSYRQEKDGTYVHVGRTDDLIKVSGQYVSPVEVEATLSSHPIVLEAAVVAHPDRHALVKPKAYVVLRKGPGNESLADELKRFVKERLAPHKYPRWIEFVETLPKTATGKIRRFALRQEGRGD